MNWLPRRPFPGAPIRVLHVCSGDLWAGAEVSAYHLLRALHRRPDVRPVAFVLNDGELRTALSAARIPVIEAEERRTPLPALWRAIVRAARSFRIDVIHSHRYKENVLAAATASWLGVAHVRSIHGLPPELDWDRGLRGLGSVLDDGLADWIGSCSIAVSDDLARRTAGMRREVHVIPNGLPSAADEPIPDELEPGDETSWRVGFVGRLEPVKRPDLFLDVMSRLPDRIRGRSVRGFVAGDGSLRARLERRAEPLVRAGRIRFLGHYPRGERLVASLHAIVIPSDHEGLPMVLLEAMRSGVAVVATAVGGIPDAIGEGGWLAPAGDAGGLAAGLRSALESPGDRSARAAHATRRFFETFDVHRVAERVAELYCSLARKATP